MGVQSSDLLIIERGGVLYKATAGDFGSSGSTPSWMDLVARPSVATGTSTVGGVTGDVRTHSKTGESDIYRFIPSDGDTAKDAFYSAFDGTDLAGLIVARG